MAITVYIGPDDRTSSVVFNSLRRIDNINQQVDNCYFSVRKYGALTFVPAGATNVTTRTATGTFSGG